jgi:conjugal transfer pilus assembly protein TraE
MKLSIHKEAMPKLLSERNIWMKAMIILSIANAILAISLAQRHEKTILVPTSLHKSFWVQGDDVSKEYLEEMGVYIAKLLLDLSPSSVVHNHTTLLRYATPEAYGTLKAQFVKEEAEYSALQLSTHFKPTSVLANPKTYSVEIKGALTRYVAGKDIKTSSETILLKFATRGTGLLLESAKTISQGE